MVWGTKSRHERGYGWAWVKVRDEVMKRDEGECQVCKRAGIQKFADEVDHIISKANAERMRWTEEQINHPSNLQSICKPCHLTKSEAEQGKVKHFKRAVGADGWPEDA